MKPRVRFVVPVWGQRYIKRFTDLSLPCFLAPGNLPALAELTDLEIVILTASVNYPDFEREPAFQSLRRIAPLRFISIDDLIIDQLSAVTLTFAYLRGVTDAGADMVNRHFLFINSDIVLADGSFRSVARRILEGHRCILANSIRAISENLEPTLRNMIDRSEHVLAVPPRRLVAMALDAMHPTQIAKIVNNDLCHSIHVNQFYWQVDEKTLISRHFLMFMLCLKPERVVTEVHAFCDYSFVPEMCPTSEPITMEDSDDFFALELQFRASENDFLRIGRPSLDEIAKSLSMWTTKDHRQNALRHTLIFHAGDLPAATKAVWLEADRYIRAIEARLISEPKPFRGHPYWTGTYEAFLARRALLRGAREIVQNTGKNIPAVVVPSRLQRLLHRVYKWLYRHPPHVRIWHPEWLDFRVISSLFTRHMMAANCNVLYVKPNIGIFDRTIGAVKVATVAAVLVGSCGKEEMGERDLTFAIVELHRTELKHTRALIEILKPLMAPGGQIAVFLKDTGSSSNSVDLADELMHHIGLVAPPDLSRTHFIFAGGRMKRKLYLMFTRCANLCMCGGYMLLPIAAIGIIVVSVLTAINNARQAKAQDLRMPVRDCSSFLLTVDA